MLVHPPMQPGNLIRTACEVKTASSVWDKKLPAMSEAAVSPAKQMKEGAAEGEAQGILQR